MPQRKRKHRSKAARIFVKAVLPVAAASQGSIPVDPQVQLELMRHQILHQLPKKSRLKQLLEP